MASTKKYDRLDETDDGTPDQGREPRKCAPMINHMGIGIAFVFVLILALVSLGAFASKHNEILGDCPRCGCILYSTRKSKGHFDFSHGKTCAFVIWGQVVIAAIAVGFIVSAVVKAVGRKKVVGFMTVIELLVIIATTTLALIIGIMISAGFSQTCNALENGCNGIVVDGATVYIYKALSIAQVSAWLGFTVLAVLALIYIVILILSRVRRSNRNSTVSSAI